jgi:3-deoxy-D-manno-octulosonic-acid transferase
MWFQRLSYVVASYFAFAVLFPLLALHRKTRDGLWQRLGWYGRTPVPALGTPRIWLHGASAGDLLALLPIIERLREQLPSATLIVSTTTNTGHAMAQRRLAPHVNAVVYAPYDLWGATRRTVRALRPDLVVLEYAELWPNLISAIRKAGARVALTNGRFSPARLRGYRALFALAGNLLRNLDLLLMRAPEEAERALLLGAPPDRVKVTGNTKFDALAPGDATAPDDGLREALGLAEEDVVLLAGSTHEGEEGPLLEVYRRLLALHPQLKLILAPRYADRAARVEALVHAAGFSVRRRSALPGRSQVVVLDTVGELARAYRLATVVFVGGSFIRRGGQNILEPAAQGRPVLFGPHMENFKDSVQVLLGRGGVQVRNADDLCSVAGELLARPDAARNLGLLAQQAVRQVSGASARNVDALLTLLPEAA